MEHSSIGRNNFVVYSSFVCSFGYCSLHRAFHLIYIELDIHTIVKSQVKVPPRKVFMYKDIDYNPMKDELRKFYGQYQESSKGKNVEQLWTEFKDKIHSIMNEHIPTN